ncbi:acetylxylan esterase [Aestuariivivens sediminis]|uniref:glucuronyl esterase domain-containing protein n=1 Tax=Aestuariivivens sediminis TaxID=2913557 RepID=UPI001F57FB2E|nr:acetylxylan esterase [Aestuariivivens sediminis]
MYKLICVVTLATLAPICSVLAQPEIFNVDESLVEPYELPELLKLDNGQKVQSLADWENERRNEILDVFLEEVYGKLPDKALKPSIEVVDRSETALNNTAIRQQWELTFENNGKKLVIDVLAYLPKGVIAPHVFVVPNFRGNQSVNNDPNIAITNSWVRMKKNAPNVGVVDHRATEASRGTSSAMFPLDRIIGNGFGLYTVYYGDIDPDFNDFSNGIHPLFYEVGEDQPKSDGWGAISAWAWGLTKVIDVIEDNPLTRDSRIIVMGHSRLGKTALWSGVIDSRIDVAISNNSGCMGAALTRRRFGETVKIINTRFPHWFSDNFLKYSDHEDNLPVDQHMLIALMAPRPVYIASAQQDRWADPKGEYLAGYYATPVYELYGKKGLPGPELPEVNHPIHHTIGYHLRSGGHGVTDYDWEQYMAFAKMHLDK